MVINCFPSYDNLVDPAQNNLFRSVTSFANSQRTRLAWVHKSSANRRGHPEILSFCGEIWIENCSHPAPDRRKRKTNLWFTAQNKHWGGLRCFWKSQGRGQERWNFLPRLTIYDDENLFSEADSPLEIQINFAHRLSKIIFKINFPEWICSEKSAEDAPRALQLSQSSRQWGRAMAIIQSKIQNDSSSRNRKTILTGDCRSDNHSPSYHSPAINPSLKLILIWNFPFLM